MKRKFSKLKKRLLDLFLGFIVGLRTTGRPYIDPAYHYPAGLEDLSFDELKLLARERADLVKNKPDGRFQLRALFYEKFGRAIFNGFGFGNSEIAFIKWEERGVLHPPDNTPPGSRWWSEVNLEFIYWSELAALIHLSGIQLDSTTVLPRQVWNWLNFIDKPSSKHWYRAHNSSIIAAYHKFAHFAFDEIHPEQIFINMVLYRLLFAQAMVEAEHFAFGKLGRFLANPRGISVDFIVNDPFFYPSTYPLTKDEQDVILNRKHNIGELEVSFFDSVLILPHAEELYETASKINGTPELMSFIDAKGKPVYPFIS